MTYSLEQIIAAQRAGGRRKKAAPLRLPDTPNKFRTALERILLELIRKTYPGVNADVAAEAAQSAEEWLLQSAEWNKKSWVSAFKRNFGIDLMGLASIMVSDTEVRIAFGWLIELIYDLHRQAISEMRTAARRAAAEGIAESVILKEVHKRLRRRAHLIAVDQTQKIFAKINERQQVEAGITSYKWQHSFLPHPRRHHVERQGNVYEWSRPPRGGHPGTEINCRCTAYPVVGGEA